MGAAHPSSPYPASRQIVTSTGPIEGRRIIYEGPKQVDAFQGIPYAAPPIGDLRFALPQPHAPWTEVRETKAFGYRGVQKDHMLNHPSKPTSEDNLTLNVFSPVWMPTNDTGFAVLVFIHGGGFVSDSAVKYGDINISKYLVTKDVVVVTLQYRLGFLGFWTTGDGTIPDNLALHDMTFALKWIKENIGAFNGDPNNVTVMGQSAGGASVDLLSLSPVSRDLFHKVIPMAGNSSCNWAIHDDSLQACRQKARESGVHDVHDAQEWIDKLRQLPASDFASGLEIGSGGSKKTQCVIAPRYDTVFLPKPLDQLRKEAPAKPRLVGLAHAEGMIMNVMSASKNPPLSTIHDYLSVLVPEKLFPTTFRQKQNKILEKLIDVGTEHSKEEWARAISEMQGDVFLNIGTQQNVIDHLETSSAPVYFYSFDYFNPKAYGLFGWKMPFKDATHCTDISYVVGVHIVNSFEFSEEDWKMVEITTRLWTNFAKYGNPNGTTDDERCLGDEVWEPATIEQPQTHLAIDLTPKLHRIFKNGRPLLYIEYQREAEKH